MPPPWNSIRWVAFFVLTFLLSWWPWPLHPFGLMPVPIASFGPFLAALAILALPRLQARWSALASALVLGALITLWHLPLMATGEMHTAEVASIMTAVLVMNWLFNHVQGSVLVLMVRHAVNNAVSGRYFLAMLDGADSAQQPWLVALTWGVVAVVLLVVGGPRDLSRRRPRQSEPNPIPEPTGHARPLVPAQVAPKRVRDHAYTGT